ncbi:MAG: HD domain-containing phosphohydrolase, partial [Acidaminobacteraceae bacterium]
ILISVLIIISLLLSFNMFFINSVRGNIEIMVDSSKSMNQNIISLDLQVRVIRNISLQLDKLDLEDKEKVERLEEAYKSNYKTFLDTTNNINNDIESISEIFSKLKTHKIFIYDNEQEFLDLNIENENVFIKSLRIQFVEDVPREMPMEKLSLDRLEAKYMNIKQGAGNLENALDEFSYLLLSDYIRFNSLIYVLVFVLILFLSSVLIRLLKIDIEYVIAALRALVNHNFKHDELPKIRAIFDEEKEIELLVENIFDEQMFINEIKNIASQGYMMDEILEEVFESINSKINVDRVGIAFIDYKSEKIIAEHGIASYDKLLLGPGFEVPFSETSLMNVAKNKKGVITNDILDGLNKRPSSTSLKMLAEEGIRSNMILPLITDQTVFGFLFFSSVKPYAYDLKSLDITEKLAYDIAALLDKSYLTKTIFSIVTNTFAELVDRKDNETGGHILRVIEYSALIAFSLQEHSNPDYIVSKELARDIERNASVHDIGKVGIPDNILKKPGKLDAAEWKTMKTHSEIGGDIFLALKESLKGFNKDFYKTAEVIARYHHERWDGTGYPEGLKSTDIPIAARIIAVCDVFDALTSKRVYKEAFTIEKAVSILKESSATHLDPVLVEVFLSKMDRVIEIYNENGAD